MSEFTSQQAEEIATKAHEGQFRRDGVTPYINHPRDVASRVVDDWLKSISWLHDTAEDSDKNPSFLLELGVPQDIVDAVALLTRGAESYDDYLKVITANSPALVVKMADMMANLADDPTDKQREKYEKGLKFFWDFLKT